MHTLPSLYLDRRTERLLFCRIPFVCLGRWARQVFILQQHIQVVQAVHLKSQSQCDIITISFWIYSNKATRSKNIFQTLAAYEGFICVSSHLQDVLPLCVLLAAQPPLFEEAAKLEAEQYQSLFKVLGLLDQQSPLLVPQLLLMPGLEGQTLQLEVPSE